MPTRTHFRFFTTFAILLASTHTVAGGFARITKRATTPASNSIVQLFEWPWDSVAQECTSFLGPFGYGYAQVSPVAEHITGPTWWTDYQPVSYNITSKRGSRAEFASMVQTCADAGVGVIADVVLNHMTGGGEGVGIGGSPWAKYKTVIYDESNFHYCAGTTGADIADFNNVTQVRTCELSGLADLAQEQEAVQTKMVAFLKDLVSLGVSGFRVDAARHMDPNDLKTIFGQVGGEVYITQEVTSGGASTPSEYVDIGSLIEFDGMAYIKDALTGDAGSVSNLVTPTPMNTEWNLLPSGSANLIVANHDTERAGTSFSSTSPNNAYVLAAVFTLGFNYGAPTVFSGYDFAGNFDAGAPQSDTGLTNAVVCDEDGWRCEHRWTAIANMNLFHNAVGDEGISDVTVGTEQQVGFGRGAKGYLVINNDSSDWSQTFTTSLPAGDYCDIIHDTDTDPTTCAGTTYTVSAEGEFTATVGAFDALAFYVQ
ncbi:Alpha-amylase [Mycena kentingensis (nom. inval.)]|nr:Alpha-amylase [Mycena kentingensis (nom. inval.)]